MAGCCAARRVLLAPDVMVRFQVPTKAHCSGLVERRHKPYFFLKNNN